MSEEDSRRSLAELFKPFAQGVLSDVLATKKPSKHHSKASSSSSQHGSPSGKRQSTSGTGKISPNATATHLRINPSTSPSSTSGKEHSHGRLERERSNSLPPLPLWEVSKTTGSAPDLLGPSLKMTKQDTIAISTTSSTASSKTPSNQNSPKSAQTPDLSSSSDAREIGASLSNSGASSAPSSAPISQSNSRSYNEREKLMHPDAEQSVYRSPRKSDGKMVIVAAPFEQLLAALTDETAHDKDMLEQFLLTHSYFIETVPLLDRLLEKFTAASAPPASSTPPSSSPSETTGSPRMQAIHVQLKLINILKKWIELHVEDFSEPSVYAHLQKTLTAMAAASATANEWVHHLSTQLSKQQQTRSVHRLPADTPGRPKPQFPKSSSKHPDNLSLLDIHPVEFARQLTLYEHERFQRIPLQDYFHKGWSRLANSEVGQLIEQFNRVSFWVASEIVTMPNHKHRTAMISRFIEIAQALQEIGNYNGLMEVISGLNLHVVQRLKLSWKAVAAKHMQLFAQMNEFMDPKCNWQTYRASLSSHSFPLLPFQGLHLTDLTFIEEMPDRMPNGVINFEKMSQLGKIFQEIRRSQGALFNFEPIPVIITIIQDMKPMSEEQLWMSSKMCEPSSENPR